jgi:hypothetical protein
MPHPFSRRVAAVAAREGVLTFGVLPITVAGPWPILTAFPASQACKLSKASLCCAKRGVNSVGRRIAAEEIQQPREGLGAGDSSRSCLARPMDIVDPPAAARAD